MSFITEDRILDSPYIETITHGRTIANDTVIRPAECHWYMVLVRFNGTVQLLVVGPWSTSGIVSCAKGAEILWIKFKLGTYMPHLPTKIFLNSETALPEAAKRSFWLNGSAWQFPTYENADVFVDQLVRKEFLVHDPIVSAVLQDQQPAIPARTIRHHFLQTTGLTQSHIRQLKRAQHAEALLQQGVSILDTVHEAGYFDQSHLTRSLKLFIGYTPTQIIQMAKTEEQTTL